jgi:FemAB-related protein (PEP-CTERM system-associated)
MIEIKYFDSSMREAWNAYIYGHKESTFFHLAEWQKIYADVLKHSTHYLYAWDKKTIVGILPLVHMRSILFGNSLISIPFASYGGALADDENVLQLLIKYACGLADSLCVDYLELRNIKKSISTWPCKDLYYTFQKKLLDDENENFMTFSKKRRYAIRKAVKEGLISRDDECIEDFYKMYSESVRNLGTPILSKKYYKKINEIFNDKCKILTILHKDEPVSSVMSFYFKDHVLPYYWGGSAKARECGANDFMCWELMRKSIGQGIKVYDFGRSKQGTGAYDFKTHLGFSPEPLNYQYYLVKSTSIPDLSPANPKYKFAINTWKRLPLSLANNLGPLVARNLG